ncbi:hypothetical protein Tco_1430063 [Tanacetum coccineum]
MDLKTQLKTVAKNHQASIQNLKNKFDRLADKQSGRPSGSLPINTQPNPRGSKAYQPPQARNEHVNAVFIRSGKSYNPRDNPDDQQNNSKNPINFDRDNEDDEPTPKNQPIKPVKETSLPKPYKPKIPYGYCKNRKKTVKTGQTRTREWKECTRAGSLIAKRSNSQPWSTMVNSQKTKTLKIPTFPADVVILEIEEDNKVPLILGRPFLHTADAVI